jgi:hypothetical protein
MLETSRNEALSIEIEIEPRQGRYILIVIARLCLNLFSKQLASMHADVIDARITSSLLYTARRNENKGHLKLHSSADSDERVDERRRTRIV